MPFHAARQTSLRRRFRNDRTDALAAKGDNNPRLCKHVVSRIAAVVERGFGIVIVLGHKDLRNARKAHIQSTAFTREADDIEL